MQHTVAVDGYNIFVLGGFGFYTAFGGYLGDRYLRFLDTRTNTWTKTALTYCKSRDRFYIFENIFANFLLKIGVL
jgi:hypothetical protein